MCAKKFQYGLGEKTPQKMPLRWLYLPFMLLLGLGSMVLATQRIAAFFDYQAALGQPWGRQIRVLQRTPRYKNLGVLAFPDEIVIPASTRIWGYPRGIQVFFRASSCGMEIIPDF